MIERNPTILGLEHGIVRLSDSSELWAELYREEEERIRTAVGNLVVDVQHIGSTAVPGIKAKPVVDMMAGVARLEKVLLCKAPLEAIGYDYIAGADIPNDHVFGKGRSRTHYLHVVEHGGAQWINHLYFRDRLRNEPELARAYESLKEELSRKFSDSRAKYHEAKSKFITEVTAA